MSELVKTVSSVVPNWYNPAGENQVYHRQIVRRCPDRFYHYFSTVGCVMPESVFQSIDYYPALIYQVLQRTITHFNQTTGKIKSGT